MSQSLTRAGLLLGAFALGCGSSPDPVPDSQPAPTYSELYESYFAPGTPGHCATAGCHADPGHTEWLCGSSKGDCYTGMVNVQLINPDDPKNSWIVSANSPLVWFNPAGGNMPFDAQDLDNAAGRAAIAAWIAAGAKDD